MIEIEAVHLSSANKYVCTKGCQTVVLNYSLRADFVYGLFCDIGFVVAFFSVEVSSLSRKPDALIFVFR